jgi:hypothetical protein
MRKVIESKTESDLEKKLLSKFRNFSKSDIELLSKDTDISEKLKKDGTEWTTDEVMKLIDTNDVVLYRALEHLYACQTEDEKHSERTTNHNGMGFNSFDAEFLTSVCKQLLNRGYLSEKQKVVCRKKLQKYKKQLTKLANE